MKPYSKDLRLRVLGAVDSGKPREEVAKTFSVSMPTIKRWLKRRRETGDLKPKPIPGRPSRKGVMIREWLPQHLEANEDLTLEGVMNPRRGCQSLAGGRGKRRRRSATPLRWRVASRNPSLVAESAMPMRNRARWTARKRQILHDPPCAALARPLSPAPEPNAPPN